MDVFIKKIFNAFRFFVIFQLLITSFNVRAVETCEAVFVASSGVATINSEDAELINFITGGLLGLNVKLSVADTGYSSLLTANIELEEYLDTLAVDLSVANKSDAVAANITLLEAIDAAITVLQNQGGNTLAIATLNTIKVQVPAGTFSFADVIDLNAEDNAVLSTTVNVLDFHMLIIQAFNHQNAISAQDISLNLSTLGLNGTFGPLNVSLSDISAALIAVEGPKLVSGPVGTAFTTSSIRLRILADLIDVAADPLLLDVGFNSASIAVTLTDFELYADVARANGTVDQLSYLTQTLRLNVTPGVASLYLGKINSAAFNDRTSTIDYASEVTPVIIGSIDISLLSNNETIALEARANANANGALESLNFVSPFPESQSTSAGAGVVNTLLSSLFTNTVLSTTPNPLLVNTTLLLDLIRSLVVDDVLSPVVSDIVTDFADPTADALGISIGNATEKVFAINGDSCIPTVDNLNTADQTPVLSGLAYRSLVDSELLTIELNNITYQENVDFTVTDNQWSLIVPPADIMPGGVYNVIATVTNGVSSISDQSTAELTIDLTQPSVQIQNVPVDTNMAFTATFAFSEAVSGFDVGDITLTNAAASDFTVVNDSTYTALITPAVDGTVTIVVNVNVAQDSVGNLNTAATQVSSSYETIRPSIVIQNVPSTSTNSFTATFLFSEAVTGFDVGDVSISNGSTGSFATVNSSTYTAVITPTSDGVVTLDVNANVAQDSAGNFNTAATQATSLFDVSNPSVAIQNVPATGNIPFTATFAFSEAVVGFDIADITLNNANASSFSTLNSSTYTALITPIFDGIVTLDVSENVAQDSVGNFNTAATQVSSSYDASRPTIVIQNVPSTSSNPFTATFSFNEAVTGFDVGDISIGNGSASGFTTVNSSTYTALITPTSDSAVTLDINANVAQDSVGNLNTAATQVVSSYDASRPSVAIQGVIAQNASAFTATFIFSEAVTGFIVGDITLTNATASNFSTVSSSTYTALITPVADGTVTLDVNANVAQDAGGNLNTAATQVTTQFNAIFPTVTIQNVPVSTNVPFTATFVFSEAVTGFIVDDITLINATASNFIPIDSSTYTALITPTTDGVVTLNVGANVAQGSIGNFNIAAVPVVSLFDTTRPSVEIQGVLAQNASAFTATFAFSEAVTGFIVGDITLTNATASNFSTVSSSTYTALITPVADGTVTLDVNANVAQDAAGNLNTAAAQVTTQFDAILPTVAIQNVPASANAPFTATFAFSEAVTGFDVSDISLINATASAFATVSSSTYTALITPTAQGLVTLNVGVNAAQDSVGNFNIAAEPVVSLFDTTRPSVAIQGVQTQNIAPFTATFTFSEAVADFIASDITLTNATASAFTTLSSSSYTAVITPIADGTITLNVNANVAQDVAGNLNTAATQVSTEFDAILPTVTIQNVPANSNTAFTATFAFSEAVTGFEVGDISLINATASAFATVNSSTYTALITPTAQGLVTLNVGVNVAQDSVGNFNIAAVPAVSLFDTTRPSVAIQGVQPQNIAPFTATFTFSEAVADFIASDITLTNATASAFTTLSSSSYTAVITPIADGTITLNVNANVAQDVAGNLNTAATQVSTEFDAILPTVTIQNVPANSNTAFTATFAFSEAVTGFEVDDISLINATASAFATVNSSTYTALITPSAQGVVTLSVGINVAQDSVGNFNIAAEPVVSLFDTTRPSVDIQGVLAQSASTFTATFTFSESVTGFIVGDITLTNATASNFATVNSSTYTALITPIADGTITLNVNANVAQDAAGNLNTAAAQVTTQFDAVLPTVVIQNVPASANAPFTATFAFSEAVTGFEVGDISLINATASAFATVNSSTYTALITPSAQGLVTLNVGINVAQDSVGNFNIAAVPAVSLFDTTRPSVEIQGVLAQSASTFTATFTFSESVTGFIVGDITLTNATASNFATVNSSTYTALITPIADGTITLNVNANVAQDAAGNLNTAAAQVTTQFDAVLPTVAIQNVPASANAPFTATFAFSEAVTGFEVGDISLINATASTFTTVNSSTYTALITPTAEGLVTLNVGINVAQDSVGNFNIAAVPAVSLFDTTRPSVEIQGVLAQSASTFTATFTFSESVTGFIVGDITLTNATASNFATVNSSTYTALITPIADGTITLNVNANVAQDAAGNLNTAAAQVTTQFDAVLPTVAIQNVPASANAPFTATFAFSEAVTGFEVTDISLINATASTFTTVNSSTYTALITPTAEGLVTLNVGINVAQDSVGNFNIAAVPAVSLFDTTRPSVEIQGVLAQSASTFTATFTFSETVTGFIVGDITLTNATASNFSTVNNSTYMALITPVADGTITLNVNANVAQDAAGNLNTAAAQVTTEFNATFPTVIIQNVPAITNAPFTATFAFSEAVTGFVVDDITLTNAGASNFIAVNSSTYTALITPTTEGLVTLNVGVNVAQDSVGNLNIAAAPVVSQFDTSRPSVAIQNVLAQNESTFTATFTFSEAVTAFIVGDITLTNATASNFSTLSGSTYTALITPVADGTVTLNVNANVAQDAAGNLNTAAAQVITLFATSRPSVLIQNTPEFTRSEFTATFTFSEPVFGFDANDISATNATINNFVIIDDINFSALITPISEGEVSLNINANVAQDIDANLNTAALPAISQYDITPPDLSILNGPAINIVNQLNYKIEGTCTDDNVVAVVVNTSNPNSVTCNAGLWELNTDLSAIADGEEAVTINANQTDNAGNIGSAEPVTFDKDTENPIISITQVTYSQNEALIFSGTSDLEDGAEVSIIESTDNNLCATPVNNKVWSCESAIVLSEGTYDLRAEARDKAENLGIIYFSQIVDFDEDNDGINNSVEGYGDTDNDGIPNAQDTDSDNDGIPDSEEGVGDDDRDNIPNYIDTSPDEDADGIPDIIEGNADIDNDGIINAFDIDSDNDGISDSFEARISGNDSDQDGIDDIFDADLGGDDPDGDGITYQAIDTDNDGLADLLDIDSDGDRIPDVLEALIGFKDIDNDGIWDRYDQSQTGGVDIDNDGIDDLYDADQTNGLDADNDGINDLLILPNDHNQNFIPDHLEIDSDSDGIHDSIEAQVTGFDHDNDGIDDAFDADLSNELDINNDGIVDAYVFVDTDADGVIDMNDLDSDNDGDTDTAEANISDVDKDGIADFGATILTDIIDTDADNIPDFLDLDKNNDDVLDIQGNANNAFDLNNDGQVDITEDIDGDGLDDSIDGDTQVLGHGSNADSDNDSVLDVLDQDDDNDGIADVTERAFESSVNVVNKFYGTNSVNSVSKLNNERRLAIDSDNDGIIDEKDRDSDNDGISDLIENGRPNLTGFDHDNDGIDNAFDADFTGGTDEDQDGVDDVYIVKDTDQDSVPDYLDLDSDNDEISDNEEQLTVAPSGFDVNGNGIDDAFDPAFNSNQDDNLDGIDDTLVVLSNPDGDDILNFQDTDSDGDNIRDIDEKSVDFDGDGTPNYLDLDSDNDNISDAVEGENDFDSDGASNFLDLDSDNDNISDEFEGNIDFDSDGSPDYLDLDSDNDGISDAIETIDDFDSDGASNYKDLDSDSDGISDTAEGENDFDSDGASNFLDLDSDGDGISDKIEGVSDFDVDGSSNYLDLDSDGDGISDAEEGDIDTDNDGTPNFLDLDSDNDGISDTDENGDFDRDGVNDANQDQRQVESSLKGSGSFEGSVILMLILLCLIRNRKFNVAVKQ